jgi:hypothetical protein
VCAATQPRLARWIHPRCRDAVTAPQTLERSFALSLRQFLADKLGSGARFYPRNVPKSQGQSPSIPAIPCGRSFPGRFARPPRAGSMNSHVSWPRGTTTLAVQSWCKFSCTSGALRSTAKRSQKKNRCATASKFLIERGPFHPKNPLAFHNLALYSPICSPGLHLFSLR